MRRSQILQEKQKAKQEQKEQEEKAHQLLLAKLEKLKQAVAVEIEADWNRILQDTESSKAVKREQSHLKYYKVPGFSSEKLMSDPRTRLMNTLHSHGLLQNAYAQELLAKMTKPKRADTISTFSFT